MTQFISYIFLLNFNTNIISFAVEDFKTHIAYPRLKNSELFNCFPLRGDQPPSNPVVFSVLSRYVSNAK